MPKHLLQYKNPFSIESGGHIHGLEVAYHTFGTLNQDRSNVVWIFHAFTANSDPTDWWSGMVGTEKYLDPADYFIVCVNILGSCYGTTGPLSINPLTGKPYYGSFPVVTVRDTLLTLMDVRKALGIDRIKLGLGFSMGGQQLLEWMIEEPDLFENVVLGATNERHSPWGIAFNESQRLAIEADATFGEEHPEAGKHGMRAARSVGLISYRNYKAYNHTQLDESHDKIDNFKVASYQRYQGEKLIKRFNAYSYWILSKAMDSHNIARNRTNAIELLNNINARTCVVGIESDHLFPIGEQEFLSKHIPGSQLHVIDSHYGHDGFLIEYEKISGIIGSFMKKGDDKL